MANNLKKLIILCAFLTFSCEAKTLSDSAALSNDLENGEQGSEKVKVEKSADAADPASPPTDTDENDSKKALASIVKEIFYILEDIKNFTDTQEKVQIMNGRSLNLFNPLGMVQNVLRPPPQQAGGPQLLWAPPTFSTEFVGSPYLPGNPHNVITITGIGTQAQPCQKDSKFVGPPPINSLGGDAAKAWKEGTDVASLHVGGSLADALAGGQGKITQDAAFWDPAYIAVQDIFAAVGGPVIDTAAQITGLGKPLQQLGIGNAFGSISGLVLGTLGTGKLLKTPLDGVKVIASLTGLQGLIGMKGKPDWGAPENVPVPGPGNPCGSGQYKIPLQPPRLSAGRR